MDAVAFITTESGTDLIVSFAVQDVEDPSWIDSLTLLRTPKYEFILDEEERGVTVFFDRYDDAVDDYLKVIAYIEAEKTVRIRTSLRGYELDVRKVDPGELKKMRQVLKKMNYDQKFQTSGI